MKDRRSFQIHRKNDLNPVKYGKKNGWMYLGSLFASDDYKLDENAKWTYYYCSVTGGSDGKDQCVSIPFGQFPNEKNCHDWRSSHYRTKVLTFESGSRLTSVHPFAFDETWWLRRSLTLGGRTLDIPTYDLQEHTLLVDYRQEPQDIFIVKDLGPWRQAPWGLDGHQRFSLRHGWWWIIAGSNGGACDLVASWVCSGKPMYPPDSSAQPQRYADDHSEAWPIRLQLNLIWPRIEKSSTSVKEIEVGVR